MYCYVVLNLEMLDILNTKLIEALQKIVIIKLHSQYDGMRWKQYYTRAYSEWFIDHPDMLENVFPLILPALGNPDVSTSATMALKDIAYNCQKFLIPFADHILIASQSALLSGVLKLAECRRLMYSIGKILSVLPVNKIMEYLNMIFGSFFQDLQKLSQAEPVLILFGNEEEFRTVNQLLLHEIINTTLQVTAQYNAINQLSDIADVLDGFFSMLANLAKKVPQLVNASSTDTTALFQCAILSLTLPELHTLKAVSSFLVHFISQSRESSQAEVVQTMVKV
ncbi:hypothetical protein NQ317_016440 [Molorchus minor]|uniref:Exportin-T n=1 Tax=Molorchus minor TaxID=1323400 RepID=A0ABQ9IS60_9CUCU|nr:hypothetical protein NQ317_016440 [Molorchus minor]